MHNFDIINATQLQRFDDIVHQTFAELLSFFIQFLGKTALLTISVSFLLIYLESSYEWHNADERLLDNIVVAIPQNSF